MREPNANNPKLTRRHEQGAWHGVALLQRLLRRALLRRARCSRTSLAQGAHTAPCADVLGVTHRLPPLACDLSAQAQPRSRPEGGRRSARPTPQRAASRRRARASRKKDKIIIFFLHIVTGNGWPVAGVGGTKIFWGRAQKKEKKFPPPPHSPHTPCNRPFWCCASIRAALHSLRVVASRRSSSGAPPQARRTATLWEPTPMGPGGLLPTL